MLVAPFGSAWQSRNGSWEIARQLKAATRTPPRGWRKTARTIKNSNVSAPKLPRFWEKLSLQLSRLIGMSRSNSQCLESSIELFFVVLRDESWQFSVKGRPRLH
jgi:hypothetical protein